MLKVLVNYYKTSPFFFVSIIVIFITFDWNSGLILSFSEKKFSKHVDGMNQLPNHKSLLL